MGTKDKRIDAYIAKSADFAKPILVHVRGLIHKAVPEVEETIKWGFPNFDHKGIMCGLAAFKEHCSLGFWKASLMSDPKKLFDVAKDGMGDFGKLTSMDDLPADSVLIAYFKEAAKLNEDGVKRPRPAPKPKKPLVVPDYFLKAIGKDKKAKATFEEFSPSHKREYVEWVTEAKTEETREKRLSRAIEWMSEGKPRNWKYLQKKK